MRPSPKFSSLRRSALPKASANFSPKPTCSLLARLSCVAKLAALRDKAGELALRRNVKSKGVAELVFGAGGGEIAGVSGVICVTRDGDCKAVASGGCVIEIAAVAMEVMLRDTAREGGHGAVSGRASGRVGTGSAGRSFAASTQSKTIGCRVGAPIRFTREG
jgi:hypothetical protein